ncbi:hypothetical protein PIB30_103057 [Stylosanthes scabra]|uniref:Uncharacterized protein n=1 Tax=Stylosanthes scabra TaxID=79078 RepID=A0ABU6T0A1_9FABA|nr:hypothetical protein [Stylosanthes scabra]
MQWIRIALITGIFDLLEDASKWLQECIDQLALGLATDHPLFWSQSQLLPPAHVNAAFCYNLLVLHYGIVQFLIEGGFLAGGCRICVEYWSWWNVGRCRIEVGMGVRLLEVSVCVKIAERGSSKSGIDDLVIDKESSDWVRGLWDAMGFSKGLVGCSRIEKDGTQMRGRMGEEEVGWGWGLKGVEVLARSCVRGRMESGQWVRVPRICVGMYAYAWVVSDGDVGEKGKWVRVPRICIGMYAYAWVVSDGLEVGLKVMPRRSMDT